MKNEHFIFSSAPSQVISEECGPGLTWALGEHAMVLTRLSHAAIQSQDDEAGWRKFLRHLRRLHFAYVAAESTGLAQNAQLRLAKDQVEFEVLDRMESESALRAQLEEAYTHLVDERRSNQRLVEECRHLREQLRRIGAEAWKFTLALEVQEEARAVKSREPGFLQEHPFQEVLFQAANRHHELQKVTGECQRRQLKSNSPGGRRTASISRENCALESLQPIAKLQSAEGRGKLAEDKQVATSHGRELQELRHRAAGMQRELSLARRLLECSEAIRKEPQGSGGVPAWEHQAQEMFCKHKQQGYPTGPAVLAALRHAMDSDTAESLWAGWCLEDSTSCQN